MLNPKQKAYLKSLAQKEKAVFQIGKDGLNENLYNDVINYLNKHELIKISILQNSFVSEEECIEFFTDEDIQFVEHKGRTFVFYMHSDNAKNPIELPKKK
ncbi:MAG: YhbY family RNA-binding protein [Acholeplasmatales bacterium]|nr:YhbY family RNA-binding protein [Acholeplasmatales bacterium]